jgi:Endonuclease-reverse transcriptase
LNFKDLKLKSRELYFEICASEVEISSALKVIFVSIYRPSNPVSNLKKNIQSFFVKLENALNKIKQKYGEAARIVVGGDTNIDLSMEHADGRQLLDIFSFLGLNLINFAPTRITSTSSTRIDQIFTNIPLNLLKVETKSNILSDHESLHLDFPFVKSIEQIKIYKYQRIYSENNIAQFETLLEQEMWSSVYLSSNVDFKYDNFLRIFKNYFEYCFPLKKTIISGNKSFILPKSLKDEGERLKMFSRYAKSSKNAADKKYLKNWTNLLSMEDTPGKM